MSFKVNFFAEEIKFKLSHKKAVVDLIKSINKTYKKYRGEVNYIFCSDAYLLQINQTYLKHDTLTDIVTFENFDPEGNLMADIFISIERVEENALKFGVAFEHELVRVLSHGMLHIHGFKDKTKQDKVQMTAQENECISQYFKMIG